MNNLDKIIKNNLLNLVKNKNSTRNFLDEQSTKNSELLIDPAVITIAGVDDKKIIPDINDKNYITKSLNNFLMLPSLEINSNFIIYPTKPIINNDRIDFLDNLYTDLSSRYFYNKLFSNNILNFYYKIKNLKYLNNFDKETAEKFFGRQCKKLSGTHPKYDVGYDFKVDYFIDNSGNQCFPNVLKNQIVNSSTNNNLKTYTKREFNLPIKKSTLLKNGNNINISKNSYPEGCKPIPYDYCLSFSWSQMKEKNNLNGVYSFTLEKYNVELKSADFFNNNPTSSVPKEILQSTKTYTAVMTEEWFPWFNQFKNIDNQGQIYVENYQEQKNTFGTWESTKTSIFKNKPTGVEIIENNYLKDKNLSSGDFQYFKSNFINLSNNFEKNNPFSNLKYKNVESKWYWVNYDHFNYDKKGTIKNASENPSYYGSLINDFYGLSSSEDAVGFDTMIEKHYRDQDILSLEKKYDEIKKQKKNIRSFLAVIAKDYQIEMNKNVPNELIKDYLGITWNMEIIKKSIEDLTLLELSQHKFCIKSDIEFLKSWIIGIVILSNTYEAQNITKTTKCLQSISGQNPLSKPITVYNQPYNSQNFNKYTNPLLQSYSLAHPSEKMDWIRVPTSIQSKLNFIAFPISTEEEKNEFKISNNQCVFIDKSSEKDIMNKSIKFFQLNSHKSSSLVGGIDDNLIFFDAYIDTKFNELKTQFEEKKDDKTKNEDEIELLKKVIDLNQQFQNELNNFIKNTIIIPSS